MHVLRLAVKEQDLLYFDGVVAVPKGWFAPVDVYIGLWSGHHGAHWCNWREPMASLAKFCQQDVFQVLHPSKVQYQLGRHLSLIDGGAGTLKTTHEGVQLVRGYMERKIRVLCDAPTVVARQNLVRWWNLRKYNGSLCCRSKLFVQWLHQYCTPAEISDGLKKGLAPLNEFEAFATDICEESHPDLTKQHKEEADIEASWPQLRESHVNRDRSAIVTLPAPKSASNIVWGNARIA